MAQAYQIGSPKIGSGVGADYIALCNRRAAEAHAPTGRKEMAMPRKLAERMDTLEGFTIYVPKRTLPQVGLQKWGDLTLPAEIAGALGAYVQVFWSADRTALALKSCSEISAGALAIVPAEATKAARVHLAPVLKHFGVKIVASSRYGAEVKGGILVLALRDVSTNGKVDEGHE